MAEDKPLMITFKLPLKWSILITMLNKEAKRLRISRSKLIIKILRGHFFLFNGFLDRL